MTARDRTGHYPYKYEDALRAGVPVGVADASQAMVEAQQAHYADPSEETAAVFAVAQEALAEARAADRAGRPDTFVGGDASVNGKGE